MSTGACLSARAALRPPKPAPTITTWGRTRVLTRSTVPCISAFPVEELFHGVIERQRARAARDHRQQQACPQQVLAPMAGKDEELNDRGDPEQGQRRETC